MLKKKRGLKSVTSTFTLRNQKKKSKLNQNMEMKDSNKQQKAMIQKIEKQQRKSESEFIP